MPKIKLIIKQEFLGLVKSKQFIIMTVILVFLPAIIGSVLFVTVFSSGILDIEPYGYVDNYGVISNIEDEGFIRYEDAELAREDMALGKIIGYYVIPEDYMISGIVHRYSLGAGIISESNNVLRDEVIKDSLIEGLVSEKLSVDLAVRVLEPLELETVVLDNSGNEVASEDNMLSTLFGITISMFFVMMVMGTSGYLLTGLMKEKRNKVMELLLSSVSSWQLLVGKVMGIGLAGLLQAVIWIGGSVIIFSLVGAIFFGDLAGDIVTGMGGLTNELPVGIANAIEGLSQNIMPLLGFWLLYFALGYIIYALLLASLGAICNVEHQAHQWSGLLFLLLMFPILLTILLEGLVDIAFLQGMSFFPLTSPVAMVIRLSGGDAIEAWEFLVSIGLLVVAIGLTLMVASKLFKSGVLLSGRGLKFNLLSRR